MAAANRKNGPVSWRFYLVLTLESLLAFYLATFCTAVYFAHGHAAGLLPGIIMGTLYAVVIVICAKRIIQGLPLPALMLIVPLAPLIALIIVISLIPVLQNI